MAAWKSSSFRQKQKSKAKHFTATGYVVHENKTLLLFHKKLKMWLPPGGHIDEGETPEEALLREIREETGLDVEIASHKRTPDPDDGKVEYLYVPHHVQLEHIPGDHPQHIDLIYFCRAKRMYNLSRIKNRTAAVSPQEHEEMRWHSLEDLQKNHIADEVRQTATRAIRHVAKFFSSLKKTLAGRAA